MSDVLNGDGDPQSVTERAEAGEASVEPEALFPAGSIEGDKVTAQSLVKRNLPTQVTVALSRAEVPTRSGLLNPDKSGRVLVSYVPGKVEHVPKHDDESTDRVTSWTLRQHLRATYVVDANDEAVLIEREFGALLELDPRRAGALLDTLTEAFKAAQVPA